MGAAKDLSPRGVDSHNKKKIPAIIDRGPQHSNKYVYFPGAALSDLPGRLRKRSVVPKSYFLDPVSRRMVSRHDRAEANTQPRQVRVERHVNTLGPGAQVMKGDRVAA